ncbi:MAG: DUF3037 domain-containing protein [Nocardioides sp.]|uniref:DUF3037 domain-containing protein n=1 Tax=Nocardioides sp. TaxID=35761 RepID=UPI0039E2FA38
MTTLAGQHPYQYVVLRCVPRADREEFVNVGVVLYCESTGLLRLGHLVVEERLRALDPGVDLAQVRAALDFVDGVCAGDARGGAAAQRPAGQRFGFLRAPRSTVIRPGPVHGGVTADPERELEWLLERLVG